MVHFYVFMACGSKVIIYFFVSIFNYEDKLINGHIKLFGKTKGQVYRYFEYKNKNKINKFERKVKDLELQIILLDNQMRNVHKYIHLDTMPQVVLV